MFCSSATENFNSCLFIYLSSMTWFLTQKFNYGRNINKIEFAWQKIGITSNWVKSSEFDISFGLMHISAVLLYLFIILIKFICSYYAWSVCCLSLYRGQVTHKNSLIGLGRSNCKLSSIMEDITLHNTCVNILSIIHMYSFITYLHYTWEIILSAAAMSCNT